MLKLLKNKAFLSFSMVTNFAGVAVVNNAGQTALGLTAGTLSLLALVLVHVVESRDKKTEKIKQIQSLISAIAAYKERESKETETNLTNGKSISGDKPNLQDHTLC